MLPPTIFFAVGFNLIVLTTNLILAEYEAHFSSFVLATTGALIVGKAVLVANALPFFRRFDAAPLIRPILFKSGVYFLAVCAVRFVEKLGEFLVHGGTFRELPSYEAAHFSWNVFFAMQIWILALFLIYTFVNELNKMLGEGTLVRWLFTARPAELRQTRRQRIHALTMLSRLVDAHAPDELACPGTTAHTQMLELIRGLAGDGISRAAPAPVAASAETLALK